MQSTSINCSSNSSRPSPHSPTHQPTLLPIQHLAICNRSTSINNILNSAATVLAFLFPCLHSFGAYLLISHDPLSPAALESLAKCILSQALLYRTLQISLILSSLILVASYLARQDRCRLALW